MKTLKNHVILFDNECPMCNIYTKGFIKSGMLEKDGRNAYQNIPECFITHIDQQRAANEIALINKRTGEVTYGINSLFKIIENTFPIFKGIFSFPPFAWLMSKIYAFISFNRRIIIPTAVDNYKFQPTFKLKYRIAYLLSTWLFTAFILTKYAVLLKELLPFENGFREYIICGAQILFQGIVIQMIAKKKKWDYLGNMMTISFAGALCLTPIILLHQFIILNPIFNFIYFMTIAGFMFLEHLRRTKILQLGYTLSFTWILYRLIVLLFIYY